MRLSSSALILIALLATGISVGHAVTPSDPNSLLPVESSSLTGLPYLPDAPQAQSPSAPTSSTSAPEPVPTNAPGAAPKQTKRIMFIIPNFRAVSADVKLPPTSAKEKFKLVVLDSFDYSAFTETAILAGMAQAQNSDPAFHSGWPAYGRYYWHNFVDLATGNIMTEFLFPVATKEDPRYYTLGHGGFVKRTGYAVGHLFITRNDKGNPTPNISEIIGNGAASGISNLYYPASDRTLDQTLQRWALQVTIDGLSNCVKEFWPEVNRTLFKGKF